MGEFRMPTLGADMVAGTLTEWYKHPGDVVNRGDIIAAVDTDKGSIDVEVFEDGVLERVVVEEGQKVPVGTLLAVIGSGAGAPAPAAAPSPPAAAAQVPPPTPPSAAAPAAPSPSAAPTAAPLPPAHGVRASPLARRLAADLRVDLTGITGSGPGGAIVKEDVEAAAARGGGDRSARMRRAIAAAMAKSNREIPHFYLATTIDLGAASAWLAQWNAAHPPAERLLPAVLLLKATALALLEFPELNARWEQESLQPAAEVHIGMVTSLRGGGLVIPAVHQVNRRTLPELMREVRELVQRARSGTLRSSDLTDGTVTVTSLGDRGADAVFGVIYPPQTALIGFGTPAERPWVVAGQVVPRQVVTASLAADHRASDGHRGGMFLATIARLLQQPEGL
ncbi:MAG: 2-oxo acid dehydrogenase subunit E2 [Gemmatimonadota bacterium]|nr:2-oxo acid dehydrogenase subunit E2 [Gemmatimonadota bacterium]MDH5282956.1 2-oxo acid dehydrogenase subunit E2 [Gemmatimonadota bacterium]